MKVCSRCYFLSPSRALLCMTCGSIKFAQRQTDSDFATSPADIALEYSIDRLNGCVANSNTNFAERAKQVAADCSKFAASHFEAVSNAAQQQMLGVQHELAELLPKMTNAYKKVVALAKNDSSELPCNLERHESSLSSPKFRGVENDDIESAFHVMASNPDEYRRLPILLRNLLSEADSIYDSDVVEQELESAELVASFSAVPFELDRPLVIEEMSPEKLDNLKAELEAARDWFQNYGRGGIISSAESTVESREFSGESIDMSPGRDNDKKRAA